MNFNCADCYMKGIAQCSLCRGSKPINIAYKAKIKSFQERAIKLQEDMNTEIEKAGKEKLSKEQVAKMLLTKDKTND